MFYTCLFMTRLAKLEYAKFKMPSGDNAKPVTFTMHCEARMYCNHYTAMS